MSVLHQVESRSAWQRLKPSVAHWGADDAMLLLGSAVAVADEIVDSAWTGRVFGLRADLDSSGLPAERAAGVVWLEDLEWLELIHRHARIVRW